MPAPPDGGGGPPGTTPGDATTNNSDADRSRDQSTTGVFVPAGYRCTCDRCVRWKLSEVPPVSRRWRAFEVRRPSYVVEDAPASWTECVQLGRDPLTGQALEEAA